MRGLPILGSAREMGADPASHHANPEVMPADDLIMSLTGPYVAGLDTVANTTAAFVYAVLNHPEVLARVQQEADAVFARGPVELVTKTTPTPGPSMKFKVRVNGYRSPVTGHRNRRVGQSRDTRSVQR